MNFRKITLFVAITALPMFTLAAEATLPSSGSINKSNGSVVSVKVTTVTALPDGSKLASITFVKDIPAFYKSVGLAAPVVAPSLDAVCEGSSPPPPTNPAVLPQVDAEQVPENPPLGLGYNVNSWGVNTGFGDGYSVSKTWSRTSLPDGTSTSWQVTSYKVTPPAHINSPCPVED